MKTINKFIYSGVLCLLNIILIFCLKHFDIRQIGPWDTSIGFSHINRAVFKLAGGFNRTWYNITSYIGILALGIAFLFACMGLYQLITRKDLIKVDPEILSLGFIYVLLAIIYIMFERFPINYRPVIIPGTAGPEPSYPSTHTILTCTIVISGLMIMKNYIKSDMLRKILNVIGSALIVIMIFGRLASGVHWFTDIVGAVLQSAMLLFLYSGIIDVLKD